MTQYYQPAPSLTIVSPVTTVLRAAFLATWECEEEKIVSPSPQLATGEFISVSNCKYYVWTYHCCEKCSHEILVIIILFWVLIIDSQCFKVLISKHCSHRA